MSNFRPASAVQEGEGLGLLRVVREQHERIGFRDRKKAE